MDSYVRWFGYEVYADPHLDCVTGSNVPAGAEYLKHTPDQEAQITAAIAGAVSRSYPMNAFFNLGKYAG